uniref:WGS project CAEQ00000000 data, annotated contig 140 n=1 Tax=Trypanosoma congolense (strain IL3000) TaxID=1068625 RepID=F9W606_TRYCI|nr:unnamed protein product [Trypanosoma congolense IL3000]
MDALNPQDFDSRTATHYYLCILSEIPHPVTLRMISSAFVFEPECEAVEKLRTMGCNIVPYRLHVFKEPLPLKFGLVEFYIYHTTEGETADPAEVHELFLDWMGTVLRLQISGLNSLIALGQPSELYSATPFLTELSRVCSFFNSGAIDDLDKVRTFILSKVRFNCDGLNAHVNARARVSEAVEMGSGEVVAEDRGNARGSVTEWKSVGKLQLSMISPEEMLWLSKQHRQFPPVSVQGKTITYNTVTVDAFLRESLAPLIEVP